MSKPLHEFARSHWLKGLLGLILSVPQMPILTATAEVATTSELGLASRRCLRCHAMGTLAYRDPATWEIIELVVDPQEFRRSSHGGLECRDCHGLDLRQYPHPERAASGELNCLDCHREDPQAADYGLERIAREFAASVHAGAGGTPGPDSLTCGDCHDPHAFRPAEIGEPLAAIVGRHNRICRSCHSDPVAGARGVADRVLARGLPRQAPVVGPHAWLPHPQAHWEAVRCIDCHTSALGDAGHHILPAEQAARRCVECHSRTARLLNDLYDYRSEEELKRRGWLAKAVFNEAYILGMSRSPALDRLSLIILAVVSLLLGAHGLGRYLAGRARREKT